MWPKIRNLHIETPPAPFEEMPKDEPQPTTRTVMMEVTVINNKTDKEYVIKSDNDFGMTWEITNGKVISINQYTNIEKNNWIAKGRFIDFSVIATFWKTFDIKQD